MAGTSTLPLGERLNVDMKLQLGTLVAISNEPISDYCVPDGRSWLYALDYKTGAAVLGQHDQGGRIPGRQLHRDRRHAGAPADQQARRDRDAGGHERPGNERSGCAECGNRRPTHGLARDLLTRSGGPGF